MQSRYRESYKADRGAVLKDFGVTGRVLNLHSKVRGDCCMFSEMRGTWRKFSAKRILQRWEGPITGPQFPPRQRTGTTGRAAWCPGPGSLAPVLCARLGSRAGWESAQPNPGPHGASRQSRPPWAALLPASSQRWQAGRWAKENFRSAISTRQQDKGSIQGPAVAGEGEETRRVRS